VAKRASRVESLLFELKRRKVFQVASLYAVAAWGASLGAADLLPAFGAPDWAVRTFVICAALGFPVAVALAWVFEITPRGVVRDDEVDDPDPGRRLEAASASTVGAFDPTAHLLVSWRDARGAHQRRFTRRFVIGRDVACELQLDDPLISRQHAALDLRDAIWWVEDLGSRNGTFVDGERLESATPLPPSCEVRLADRGPQLRMEIHVPPSATTVASGQFRRPRHLAGPDHKPPAADR
jgi:FHA domain